MSFIGDTFGHMGQYIELVGLPWWLFVCVVHCRLGPRDVWDGKVISLSGIAKL